jgi:hypothetical protein
VRGTDDETIRILASALCRASFRLSPHDGKCEPCRYHWDMARETVQLLALGGLAVLRDDPTPRTAGKEARSGLAWVLFFLDFEDPEVPARPVSPRPK